MRAVRYLLLLLVLVALGGCGGSRLQSHWRDREVVVDGQDTEWDDARFWLPESRAGLGLMNDGEYLYVALSLTDPDLQVQVMRRGFTVWFDCQGGRRQTAGLRFPMGMMERGGEPLPEEGERPAQTSGPPRMRPGARPEAKELQAMFERLSRAPEMLVLGPGAGQQRRVPCAEGGEALLKTSFEKGRLVYEVRVPLAADFLGAQPGPWLGLGFETPELDLPAFRQRRGGAEGGMHGGAMHGGVMGGGMSGGRPGGGPGGPAGNAMPESFRLWTKVRLAAGPAAAGG